MNTTTKGMWRGVLGTEGAAVAAVPFKLPSYLQVSVQDASLWTWSTWSPDLRGMQYPEDMRKHMASCWYGGAFTINLSITDGRTHRVSI